MNEQNKLVAVKAGTIPPDTTVFAPADALSIELESPETVTLPLTTIGGIGRVGKTLLMSSLLETLNAEPDERDSMGSTLEEYQSEVVDRAESIHEQELDKISTQIHELDDRIAEDREETIKLGQETRAKLAKLKDLVS